MQTAQFPTAQGEQLFKLVDDQQEPRVLAADQVFLAV